MDDQAPEPRREFVGADGHGWVVTVRPTVRKGEAATHVTLELSSVNETRVVSCPREEWYTPEPDFEALLARSIATGASRSIYPPGLFRYNRENRTPLI